MVVSAWWDGFLWGAMAAWLATGLGFGILLMLLRGGNRRLRPSRDRPGEWRIQPDGRGAQQAAQDPPPSRKKLKEPRY
jgi:hypothetical protein